MFEGNVFFNDGLCDDFSALNKSFQFMNGRIVRFAACAREAKACNHLIEST